MHVNISKVLFKELTNTQSQYKKKIIRKETYSGELISDEYIADHVGAILNNYRLKGCLRLGVLTIKPVLYIPN